MVLYVLPLSKEVRLRIMRSIWGDAHDDYVDRVLFQPGGIWKINPDWCKEEEDEVAVAVKVEKRTIGTKIQVENDLELTYDDDDDADDSDSQFDVNEHSTIDTVDATASLQEHEVEQAPSPEQDTIEQIGLDIIRQMLRTVLELDHTNETQIKSAGIAAAVALFMQMKYSPAARRTVLNVAHGSAALGLGCVAVGALGSVHCKNKLMQWTQQDGNSRNIPRQMPSSYSHAAVGGLAILNGTGIGIGMLRTYAESLLFRFRNDAKFKRKWQSAVAFVVLYYFRQSRRRSRIVSRRR